jgi:gliding motility-associated-like protein
VSNPNPLQSMGQYVYNYTDSGTYIIKQTTITDKGCRDSVSHPVRVNPIYTIYVPNTFTPNDDGVNDYFMVRGINIKELSLIIFDRYGEVIARIQDISSKGWDGTDIRQGKLCQQEVYNWKLEYTDVFNTKHKGLVGTVTLVK